MRKYFFVLPVFAMLFACAKNSQQSQDQSGILKDSTYVFSSGSAKQGEVINARGKQFLIGYVFNSETSEPVSNATIIFSDSNDSESSKGVIDCSPFKLNDGQSIYESLALLREQAPDSNETPNGPTAVCVDQSVVSYGFGPCIPCVARGNLWRDLVAITDDNGRYEIEITSTGLPYFAFASKKGLVGQTSNEGMISIGKNINGHSAVIEPIYLKRQ